jgi:hypothetical protein
MALNAIVVLDSKDTQQICRWFNLSELDSDVQSTTWNNEGASLDIKWTYPGDERAKSHPYDVVFFYAQNSYCTAELES